MPLLALLVAGCGAPKTTPGAASAVLDKSALTFPATTAGSQGAAESVSLTNTGTAPLAMGTYALSDKADFAVTTTCGATLAAGASCVFAVQFTPQMVSSVSATLTLHDNSGDHSDAAQVIALTGSGIADPVPQAEVQPASLSFGQVAPGSVSAVQTVTLRNSGTAALLIGTVALSDTRDFALRGSTCGPSLAVAATCAVTVMFTPQTTGDVSGSLQIPDNAGGLAGAIQSVPLHGTGFQVPLPQLTVTPGQLAFDNAAVGTTSSPQVVTLSNTGTAPLAIQGLTLADTADFAVNTTCASSLAPGATCTAKVSFLPQSPGVLSSSLTITDNSGGSTAPVRQTVLLTGTGVPAPVPQAVFSTASIAFGAVHVGTGSTQQFSLTNTGSAVLAIAGVTATGSADFTVSSGCGQSLAPGASCVFAVTFKPSTTGPLQGTVTVVDNSGGMNGAQQAISLTGTGMPTGTAVLSVSTLAFPKTPVGTVAAPSSVTLTNAGAGSLVISAVNLAGTKAGAFAITGGNCSGTLIAGDSCTETVVYQPVLGSLGDSASLVFTDDSSGQPGSMQQVTLSGSALAVVSSVENFGDSLTCGLYAEPHDGTGLVYSLEGYAGLFDAWLGVPAQNWCRQGDTAADLSRMWVPWNSTPTSTGNQVFTLMVGANDAYRYGIPQSALSTYSQEVGAALAWLAIPNSDKVLANTMTQQTGNWSPDVGFGMISGDAGASLTFNVNQAVAGRNLYVVYHVWAVPYGQAGTASIAVDGTVQATVEESQRSLVNLPTENGTYDTFLLQTVPLGAAGPHTVTFAMTGPSGAAVGLLWAGVAQQDYNTVAGAPRVLLGLITNSPSGNQTYAADIYNLQLKSLVPALIGDGMNITLVPTDRVLDPNADFADILHPNNGGHAKLAATFEQYR